MPRVRLAVALLVPEPAATEIDGLRRALGDPGIAKVVPHITLVNPVNVAVDRLPDVLADLRQAAASTPPIDVRLGHPATFSPVSPVVYLPVEGDRADVIDEVREVLRSGVLGASRSPRLRSSRHDHRGSRLPERIEAALTRSRSTSVDVRIDRLHLLQDQRAGPAAVEPGGDAVFEVPLVVGTGGLPMEIASSALADPEVATLFVDEPLERTDRARPDRGRRPTRARDRRRGAGGSWPASQTFAEVVGDADAGTSTPQGCDALNRRSTLTDSRCSAAHHCANTMAAIASVSSSPEAHRIPAAACWSPSDG